MKHYPKKIVILGVSRSSIDILDTINTINLSHSETLYDCYGFLDDDKSTWGKEIYGQEVLGSLTLAKSLQDCCFVNGIGSPLNFWRKKDIISKTGLPLERFETIIHPSASVSQMSKLGFGSVVFQNVTITSNVKVGNHVIILPNTVISHDSVIGDYTCIAGGVCMSGGVKVGSLCYLGTNSSILSKVTIEDYCLVGMGGVVLNNCRGGSIYAGNPARFLKKVEIMK